jgi:DNA-binding transcriptional ArsR family regulator
MKPIKSIEDPRYVKALSHPLRVRILAMLRERDASPVELAEWLKASLGTVAYHVRTLERFGLIELVKETKVRGAIEHHYRARHHPVISDESWARTAPIAKQAVVDAALQTNDDYVRASAAAGGFDRSDAFLARHRTRLDAKGFAQLNKACKKLVEQAERIEQAAAKRIERDPHSEDIVEAGISVLLFEAVRLTDPNGADVADDGRTSTHRRRRRSAAR